MTVEVNLKKALAQIVKASKSMRVAQANSPEDGFIIQALNELKKAKSEIERAIKDIG